MGLAPQLVPELVAPQPFMGTGCALGWALLGSQLNSHTSIGRRLSLAPAVAVEQQGSYTH